MASHPTMASSTDMSYLEMLFSTYGFHALAVSISKNLDYVSSVQLKRCSKIIYEFFKTKESVLKKKWMDGWRDHFSNECDPKLDKSFEFAENASQMKFIDVHTLAVAHEDKITLVDIDSGDQVATLKADRRSRERKEKYELICFEVSSSHLFASLWEIGDSCELCVFDLRFRKLVQRRKQPEMITAIKLVRNLLITAYDVRLGTVLVRDVSDIDNMSVIPIYHQSGCLIRQLDAVFDSNKVLIAFVDLFEDERSPNLWLSELQLPQNVDTLPLDVVKTRKLDALTGYSEDWEYYNVQQCQFLDSNRLAVTDDNECIIILSLEAELNFPVQRVIKPPMRGCTNLVIRGVNNIVVCLGDAMDDSDSADSIDPKWDTDLMLIDVNENNKDYKQEKNQYKGKGILREELTTTDTRLLWNQKSIDRMAMVNAVNARYLGYVSFGKIIVHDVFGPK